MATIKQQAVQKKRNDPRLRPLDPMEAITRIVDANPDYVYRWVPLHGEVDVTYYEALGYEKVAKTEGGARPHRMPSGIVAGAPIVQNDHVLMAMPKEQHKEEIWEPGQADMSELEKKIYDKEFARRQIQKVSGVSGMMRDGEIDAINDTSPLTPGI